MLKRNRKICIGLSLIMMLCTTGITGCGKSKKEDDIAKIYENQVALPNEVSSVAAFTTDKNSIYIFGTDTDKKYVGIYKTSDFGKKWEKLDKNSPEVNSRIDQAVLKTNGDSYILTDNVSQNNTEENSKEPDNYALNKIVDGKEQSVNNEGIDQLKIVGDDVFFVKKGTVYSENGEKMFSTHGQFSGRIDSLTKANGLYYLEQEGSVKAFEQKTYKEVKNDRLIKKLNKVSEDGTMNVTMSSDDKDRIKMLTQNNVYTFTNGKLESKKKLVNATINSRATIIKDSKSFENGLLVQTSNQINDKLVYVSDKKMKKKNNLRVYSLYQNEYLNTIVSEYASKNPDTSIEMEIGIDDEDDNKTPSDAIKKLNTEMLAGDGPDIIMLDGLSVDKLIKQKMLVDLTTLRSKIKSQNNLLNNIVDENTNKAYEIPTHFSISTKVGTKEFCKADSVKEYYDKFSEMGKKSKPAFYTENYCDILDCIYKNYIASGIEKNNLKESDVNYYFKLANKLMNIKKKTGSEDNELTFDMHGTKDVHYQGESVSKIYSGDVQATIEEEITSGGISQLQLIKEKSGIESMIINNNYYEPIERMAICKKCKCVDEAKDFIEEAVSKENQATDMLDGFPVNVEALNKYLSYETSVFIGKNQQLQPITSEQQVQWIETFKNLKNPVIVDSSIKYIVYEQVNQLNKGKVTIDDATKNVIQKVKLYQKEN
ncbi:hypothetical protein [Lachnobacterium bovis]|uniref:ABC-type glycerol-3-phosphate transport system, substrate-binding protein n=1 Tax=Lachnobacterium bovis DSM 14045 TaxID=1122142 RepID=A0A1H3IKT0_9FIRM|nr:hypothetical protein [Lachnobacterium bovis]SDY28272.1 ABC-type glycerol-3-phosphate transport system, substrate-binding protein [Lachnobacterium bovis DSM 14045]